jgi:hypothetical protein
MLNLKIKNIFRIIIGPFLLPSPQISFAVQFLLLSFLYANLAFNKIPHFKRIYLYFIVFSALQFITLIQGGSFSVEALIELSKPYAFFYAFALGSLLNWSRASMYNDFFKPLVSLGLASLFLGLIEYLGIITPYSRVIDFRENLLGRFLGLFGTSYFAASVYLLIGVMSLYLWKQTRLLGYAVISLVFFSGSLLTQSRTSFIAASFLLLMFLAELIFESQTNLKIKKGNIVLLIFPLLLIGITIMVLITFGNKFSYITIGLFGHYLPNFLNQLSASTGSIGQRMLEIRFVLDSQPFPFLGISLEDPPIGSLESLYSYIVYHVGFIGLIFYFFFIISVYRRVKFLAVHLLDTRNASIFMGLSRFILILPVLSFASVITDQIRLFSLFYFTFGIAFSNSFPLSGYSMSSSRQQK